MKNRSSSTPRRFLRDPQDLEGYLIPLEETLRPSGDILEEPSGSSELVESAETLSAGLPHLYEEIPDSQSENISSSRDVIVVSL